MVSISKVRLEVEIDILDGDDEGLYTEEFKRELAEGILEVLLGETEPAEKVFEELERERQQRDSQ